MRKQTLRTSAIALGVVAALPATAQEWDVNWGGFMRQFVLFGDTELRSTPQAPPNAATTVDERSGISQRRNAELQFTPSVTLENGITFGVTIEVGGVTAGVDESYVTIGSDTLGQLILGAENSVGALMMLSAPGVSKMAINSGIYQNFIPVKAAFRQAASSSFTEVGANNDPMRISYLTPSLGGLTLGFSYAADGVADGNHSGFLDSANTNRSPGDLVDIMDIAASFNQSFGEANVTLAARYGTARHRGATEKPREFGIGLNVGFGAFTIGGTINDSKRSALDPTNAAGQRLSNGGYSNNLSSDGWSLGMTYDMEGPWQIGIDTYQGEWDDGEDTSATKIGASRTLGPGVTWDIYALTARSRYTVDPVAATQPTPGNVGVAQVAGSRNEGRGELFGTAINLSF